jgi:hypothetical protein
VEIIGDCRNSVEQIWQHVPVGGVFGAEVDECDNSLFMVAVAIVLAILWISGLVLFGRHVIVLARFVVG